MLTESLHSINKNFDLHRFGTQLLVHISQLVPLLRYYIIFGLNIHFILLLLFSNLGHF